MRRGCVSTGAIVAGLAVAAWLGLAKRSLAARRGGRRPAAVRVGGGGQRGGRCV